ncbi:glutamate--cysteine ligase [Roseiarcus fermentans]|uniref:Glutamate--cysteine ligase n=1 Tax=Roseiarcus fermentans TaxID=1473586 RepID=A0A366FNT7_9HYPH|nr:glutamate--cysteine ligase [Roseiarcus fermentans]RBP15796.1 glutamate--cysteine ligase [Roseiarcus fermentans]
MARDVVDGEIVESRDALAAWFEAGCKRDATLRVGTEHEKILFYRAGHAPVPYAGERGVAALLEGMNARLGWERIEDGGHLIGLFDQAAAAAISLEPGGQFELSGAPMETAHETAAELARHVEVWRSVADPLGLSALSLGMSPKWTIAETPVMPKSRYGIMQRYMPKVGTRGLDMMFRTATVQTNFDFRDEKDMVIKLRVALALQPAITALFANSPFTDGRLNGFLSARSEIWRDTDPDRTGTMPFAFEPGMGFERYVDYALDVPLYFLKRGSTYHDVAGASFRDLLNGRLAAAPGERATIADWANHLSTIFPEVRLKRYLEMRGADVGPPARVVAMTALTSGLFYDSGALAAAAALVEGWTAEDRQTLRDEVPRLGFAATIRGRRLRDVAVDMVAIARGGLAARANRNAEGEDERVWLQPLEAIADSGRSAAEAWIDRFNGPWGGSVEPAFEEALFE